MITACSLMYHVTPCDAAVASASACRSERSSSAREQRCPRCARGTCEPEGPARQRESRQLFPPVFCPVAVVVFYESEWHADHAVCAVLTVVVVLQVNWTAAGAVTAVKDQGICGACRALLASIRVAPSCSHVSCFSFRRLVLVVRHGGGDRGPAVEEDGRPRASVAARSVRVCAVPTVLPLLR